jgi:hypothetical protein
VDASLINGAACVASALPTAWLADLSALASSQGECGFGSKRESAFLALGLIGNAVRSCGIEGIRWVLVMGLGEGFGRVDGRSDTGLGVDLVD